MMRLAEEQRHMHFTQAIELALRVAMPPDDNQIGLQRDDPFKVERLVVADARQLLRLRRIVAIGHGADQFWTTAGRIQ